MSRRIAFCIVAALVLLYAGIAGTLAEPTDGAELSAEIPVVQVDNLRVSLHQGPKPLCPGWHLYTTLVMTNTSEVNTLTGIVVSDTAPAGTWVHEPDLAGPFPATYDEASRTITWDVGDLAPLASTSIAFKLRTFSSLVHDQTITQTMAFVADQLDAPGTISDTVSCDTTICDPTPTPTSTPTNTPTPTATPTNTPVKRDSVYLPVILN